MSFCSTLFCFFRDASYSRYITLEKNKDELIFVLKESCSKTVFSRFMYIQRIIVSQKNVRQQKSWLGATSTISGIILCRTTTQRSAICSQNLPLCLEDNGFISGDKHYLPKFLSARTKQKVLTVSSLGIYGTHRVCMSMNIFRFNVF